MSFEPTDARVHVVGAAIYARGKCLIARRAPGGSAGGKWEFPGGKVRPNEDLQDALRREIREELKLEIHVGCKLGQGSWCTSTREIVLHVYATVLQDDDAKVRPLADHDEIRWVGPDELLDFDWAEADIPVIDPARRWLREIADNA